MPMSAVRHETRPSDTDVGRSGAIERTLKVLELLAHNAEGLHLSEIAEQLRIPQSATHRILSSLTEQGYVRQRRSHRAYCLTVKVASLGFAFLAGCGVTNLAQPILDRVAAEVGELVRLAIVDGRQLVWVAKAQGMEHGLRYDPDMGQTARLSCSASGQAWLSCLPDDEAIALVEEQGYGSRREFGPRAPETRQALLRATRLARKRGFSLTVQTYAPWMNAIASPIRQPTDGEVVGAIVIAGPEMRLSEAVMLEAAPRLIEAANELSLAMLSGSGLRSGRARIAGSFFDEGK
jgi:IclR family acetate operon transcriptional repressor